MSREISILAHARDAVGESPLWVTETGRLWWIDIARQAVRSVTLAGDHPTSFDLAEPPGALALDEDGRVIVAAGTGWSVVEAGTGELWLLTRAEGSRPGWRLNDGCVDPVGRFWTGAVDMPRGSGAGGALWCLDADGPRRVADGLGLINGIAFSPDGRTMYTADSRPEAALIRAHDFDVASGEMGEGRVFHRPERGRPDGAAVDAEGCYWFAAIDAGEVVRLDPDGARIEGVDLPASRPTKPAFAGTDLTTLCVTTMSLDRADEPLAGAVLTFDAGVAGWPQPRMPRVADAPVPRQPTTLREEDRCH